MKPPTGFPPINTTSAAAAFALATAFVLSVAPAFAAPQEPPAAGTLPPSTTIPAAIVRVVTVEGAHALEARTVITAAARVSVGKPGNHDTLREAIRAITTLYRERGYPVAQVVSADVSPDGVLRLTVAEGRVRRIVVRGNKKTHTATILEVLGLRAGDVYNTAAVRDDRSRLARLGLFNDVTITAQVPGAVDEPLPGLSSPDTSTNKPGSDRKDPPPSSDTIPVPGGDTATAPPPAGGQAGAKTGAPTGAIGTGTAPEAGGTVNPVPVAAPVVPPLPGPTVAEPLPLDEDRVGDVDLVVRVSERQTANIAATVGYSDAVGAVGFIDLSELNLAGTGQRLAIQWQRASNSYVDPGGTVQRGDSRQAFNLSFAHPALGLRSTAYSLNVYNQNTVFLPYFSGVNYTIRTFEKRNGATARVGHALSRRLTGYVTARHDEVGYDFFALQNSFDTAGIAPVSRPDLVQSANGRVGAVGLVLVGDGRDAADNPHRGYLHSLTLENSNRLFGANRLFRQATLDLRQYTPLSLGKNGPVFAARLLTGLSTGDVPLPEQFFLGGYELLRGYELYSLYGDRMILGTAELRAPLSTGVQGVAFVDAGNTYLPGVRFGSGGVKAGVGVGLRFLSPIGPIRFDAAYGDQFRTYISLGQSF